MDLIPWRRKRGREDFTAQPETALDRLRHEMESLLDRYFHDPWAWPGRALLPSLAGLPRTDLAESDQDVTVTMELPGVDPNDVDLDLTADVLTVRGEKRQEGTQRERNCRYRECHYGSFQRTVQLPPGLDPDRVDARFKEGVLTVTIGKDPNAKARRIPVRRV
jgi:HSP20 family protein